MSASKRGIRQTPEHAKKGALSRTGLKHSPETKAKMSAWQKGVLRGPMAIEIRRKMSASKMGCTFTPERNARLSAIKTQYWREKKLKEQEKMGQGTFPFGDSQ